jgi:hypothetical protein
MQTSLVTISNIVQGEPYQLVCFYARDTFPNGQEVLLGRDSKHAAFFFFPTRQDLEEVEIPSMRLLQKYRVT